MSSLKLNIVLSLLGISIASADTSPLSAFPGGYGIEVSGYNSRERGMGEAGMASVNRQGPSFPNPSRTAWNEKTSFAATFDSDLDYLQDSQNSNRFTSFLLPAIAMNFQTRLPMNIALDYRQLFHRNFSYTPFTSPDPSAIASLSAEGGLYEVGGNLAYAPLSILSLSLGYHFILGHERSIESKVFSEGDINSQLYNGIDIEDTLSVRSSGGYPSASMTFRQKTFSLAASGSLGSTLDRTLTRSVKGLLWTRKMQENRDLPLSLAVGGAFKPLLNQTVVADFSWEGWDQNQNAHLNPAFHLGTGYEYQGSGGPYDRYYRKMALRGGLGFERLYLDQTDLYFLTTGASLPLGRRGNLLDVALKYGHRGSIEDNFWTEDFIKLSLTLTGVGVWGQPVRKRR